MKQNPEYLLCQCSYLLYRPIDYLTGCHQEDCYLYQSFIDGNVKGNSVLRMCKLGPNSTLEDSVRIVTDTNNYFHTAPVASTKGGPVGDIKDLKSMKIPDTKGKKW